LRVYYFNLWILYKITTSGSSKLTKSSLNTSRAKSALGAKFFNFACLWRK
jgi:hypothetical protein